MSACGFNQEMTCVCCTSARGPCTDGLPLSASTGRVPPMAAPQSHDWCLCSLFAGLSGPGRCARAGLALPMHENEPAQAAMACCQPASQPRVGAVQGLLAGRERQGENSGKKEARQAARSCKGGGETRPCRWRGDEGGMEEGELVGAVLGH